MRRSLKTLVAMLTFASMSGVWAQGEETKPAADAGVLRAGTGSFADALRQSGAAAPVAAAVPGSQFVLRKGELINVALIAWAKSAGWDLFWEPDVSWKAKGDTSFTQFQDVTLAVTEVISILREEGRPVRLNIADGNRIMEVISTDVVSNKESNGE